jgi:plastocyanin
MKKSLFGASFVLGLAAVLILAGCAKSSNPVYGGGGGKILDSSTLAPGAQFSHVFASAMTVPYYCKFHGAPGGSGMSGIITVQAGGTAGKDTVSMVGMTFVPSSLTVNAGSTVIWINNSTLEHTVTSDN